VLGAVTENLTGWLAESQVLGKILIKLDCRNSVLDATRVNYFPTMLLGRHLIMPEY
jgi:hypothetical protein